MQLLETKKENYIGQADPFILESSGRYYIYTTGDDGIYAYSSDHRLAISRYGVYRAWGA